MNIDYWQEIRRVQENRENAEIEGLPATLTLEEWTAILEQFQGMCAYCLTRPFEVLDHLIPLSAGKGGTVANNCLPSCRRCNSRKCGYYEDATLSPTERIECIRYLFQHNLPIRRSVTPSLRNNLKSSRRLMVMTPEDLEIIAELKQYHGIASDNEVIRMALRAAKRELPPTHAPSKDSPLIPPPSRGRDERLG